MVAKNFFDLSPSKLSESLRSHSTVAQAWGTQTLCQRLGFPKVRASLCSPGDQQTTLCCCTASCVYDVGLTQPCSRRWVRGFLLGRPTLAITRPCGERTADCDVVNMRVTCRWLVFTECGAESLLSL